MMHRRTVRDAGFTLVELIVVVVIVGVLAAIAIPVFANQRARGMDAQVVSQADSIIKAVETSLTSEGGAAIVGDSATGAVSVDSTLTTPVATTDGVSWAVTGSPAAYCITVWSTAGGKYTVDAPLRHDSVTGKQVPPGSDCGDGAISDPGEGEDPGDLDPPSQVGGRLTYTLNLNASGCSSLTVSSPFRGEVDGTIDWGDGTREAMAPDLAHTYATRGVYTVTGEGEFTHLSFQADLFDALCLISVDTWEGDTGTTSMANAFRGAQNLTSVATPPSGITNMNSAFRGALSFNGQVSDWDTSAVTNMWYIFYQAWAFNRDLSSWDTSNVTNLSYAFYDARVFNGNVSTWDTSNVTTMSYMFYDAKVFNRDISGWRTSNVTNMNSMFRGALKFNSPLPAATWDTSNVTNMYCLFYGAAAFNQDISEWQTGKVENMNSMFYGAQKFNQDLSGWDVSAVTGRSSFDVGAAAWVLPRPAFP